MLLLPVSIVKNYAKENMVENENEAVTKFITDLSGTNGSTTTNVPPDTQMAKQRMI